MPPHESAPASFYAVQGGNDIYWRVEAPAKAIGARLCVLPESEAERQFKEPDSEFFTWRLGEGVTPAEYPEHEGAAVWTRPDPLRSAHIDAMQAAGILTVAEVDDNYIANPDLNIFTRANQFNETLHRAHLAAMASADRIVFSTAWLRDHYWKRLRKMWSKSALPEPFVCRNNVDEKDWPEPVPRAGPLRVTWMGSPMHIWDVHLAWPAMLHAKRNLGCETIVMGYDPSEIQGDSERSLFNSAQWSKAISRVIPWQQPADYHRTAVPADIGLCPLIRNDHTLGKSDVKAVEYAISGAAVIAQNNEVYNRSWVHGETALLVGSPEEMLQAVERLVRDDNLRERLIANARQYVREERGLKQLKEEWGAAISG